MILLVVAAKPLLSIHPRPDLGCMQRPVFVSVVRQRTVNSFVQSLFNPIARLEGRRRAGFVPPLPPDCNWLGTQPVQHPA